MGQKSGITQVIPLKRDYPETVFLKTACVVTQKVIDRFV